MANPYLTNCRQCGSTTLEPKRKGELIGDYLDRIMPHTCYACSTPVTRMKPDNVTCERCGLDQNSAEAYAIARQKGRTLCQILLHQ